MEYHLKPIEQFVSFYLKTPNPFIDQLNEPILSALLAQMDIEISKTKTFISESFHSFDEEKTGIYFIQNHQRRIITIVNQISDNLNIQFPDPATGKLLLMELSLKLLDLLAFLEQNFVHCLDQQMCITREYGTRMATSFLKIIANFDISFHRCDSLMDIALEPVHTFSLSDLTSYSYERVKYMHRLMKEIERLSRTECIGVKNSLIDILFLINFNNNSFYKYLTKMIQKDVDRQTDDHLKLQKFKLHLKHFRQKNSKQDIAFLPDRKNIKDQVVPWIVEEIEYLESNIRSRKKRKTDEAIEKFDLKISVDQLAVLIKIGKATGLIHIGEISPFTRFISKFFSTKQQTKISARNLRNKVYKTEIHNPEQLKTDLLNLINKYL
jgi:hypothetical protein